MSAVLKKTVFAACAAILLLSVLCSLISANFENPLFPWRFYHVLTDSMEPAVPADSLVCVRLWEESRPLKEGDIVTFQADRFGQTTVITHRFSHAEKNDAGELIYRTHPEKSSTPDPYETTQEDLLGVYVFHIPYIGKFILFLKSSFGFLWLCQIITILFVRKMLLARWEEQKITAEI